MNIQSAITQGAQILKNKSVRYLKEDGINSTSSDPFNIFDLKKSLWKFVSSTVLEYCSLSANSYK